MFNRNLIEEWSSDGSSIDGIKVDEYRLGGSAYRPEVREA